MTRPQSTSGGLAARLPAADPRVHRFFAAWRALRGDRLVPRKSDFDPVSVAPLLSAIWLYRFDPALDDFVCLLAGEAVNDAWGGSIKGKRLREIVGEADHPVVLARWRRIVSVPLVHYGAATERLSAQDVRRAERLILPLADDDGSVSYTLGLSLYRIATPDPEALPLVPEDITQIPCSEL